MCVYVSVCLQVYNVRTLSKAIHIFHTISSITYTASETTPTLITSLLTPVLPEFVQGIFSFTTSLLYFV